MTDVGGEEAGDVGNGVVAQLGARLHGVQEVEGSIPFDSIFTHPARL